MSRLTDGPDGTGTANGGRGGGPGRGRPARKRFGQHFLAPAWADKVIEAVSPQPEDRFLEIGPGPGALTTRLARRVRHLTAVEVDRDFAAELAAGAPPHVTIVTADFLALDLAASLEPGPLRVAGNVPYNISSPILFKLLDAARATAGLVDATLMLQREVADRLIARVGTGDYGVLTIFASLRADTALLLSLPPGAFRPIPKVHSSLVRMTFHPPRVHIDNPEAFTRLVRSIFTQRRKTLSNALRPFAESIGADARAALAAAAIDPMRRPETLTLEDLARLGAALALRT